MLTEFTYAHYFDICSLFLHMLTVLICGHCFYICVAWSVSSWLLSGTVHEKFEFGKPFLTSAELSK
jgi:hypothetical protein